MRKRTTSRPSDRCAFLIVDARQEAADAMVRLVRYWGHDGRAAYDGAMSLALAASLVPEVVLMDLAMPGTCGSELAKNLRLDARLKRCFLIAVTEHPGAWRRGTFNQTDFDLFLPKPIDGPLMKTLLLLEGRRLGSARTL